MRRAASITIGCGWIGRIGIAERVVGGIHASAAGKGVAGGAGDDVSTDATCEGAEEGVEAAFGISIGDGLAFCSEFFAGEKSGEWEIGWKSVVGVTTGIGREVKS